MVLIAGLTGGIGTGKSTVLKMLAEKGAAVLSSDAVVHELLECNESVREEVIRRFGPKAYREDGKPDKAFLADKAFSDEASRKALERILHPRVIRRVEEWMAGEEVSSALVAVVEVPLLFESGMDRLFESTIVVAAEHARQLSRLSSKGLSSAQAEARIAAQMPLAEKISRADYVVQNDASLEQLRQNVDDLWRRLVNDTDNNRQANCAGGQESAATNG